MFFEHLKFPHMFFQILLSEVDRSKIIKAVNPLFGYSSEKNDKVISSLSLVTGVLRMKCTDYCTVVLRQGVRFFRIRANVTSKIKSRIDLGQIRSHMNWKIYEFFEIKSFQN